MKRLIIKYWYVPIVVVALLMLLAALPGALGASDTAVTRTTLKLRNEPKSNAKVLEMFRYLTETIQDKNDDGEIRDAYDVDYYSCVLPSRIGN